MPYIFQQLQVSLQAKDLCSEAQLANQQARLESALF
jgi:hypothetical protein